MVKSIEYSSMRQRDCYIVNQRQKGNSAFDISEEMGLSKRSVERVYSRYINRHFLGRKLGSGRRSKLTVSMKLSIQRQITSRPYLTCQDLADKFDNVVSSETIRRYLKKQSFRNKWPSSIPNLSAADKARRLTFAEENVDLDFDRTFFTDECIFSLNDHKKVWGKKGKRVKRVQYTYPAKVQVWGAISAEGKCYLQTIEGTLDGEKYASMLEEEFIPEANAIFGEGNWGLQHDGARPHIAHVVRDMLDDYDVEPLDWPARSPDLNPIENIWGILKSQVYKRNLSNRDELEEAIFEEWERLDNDMVAKVAMSFNNRLQDVMEVEGEAIDY